jgi:hypothetical protein
VAQQADDGIEAAGATAPRDGLRRSFRTALAPHVPA